MAIGNPLPTPAFTLEVADVPAGANPPSGVSVVPLVGGGAFAAGQYYWVETAINGAGESLRSREVTATIALNGSAALNSDPVAGATGYRYYRGTVSGAEGVYFASATPAFTDTGAAGTAGTPPAVGAWSPVSLVNSWDADYAASVSEYDVFNISDPIEVNGRAKTKMSFGGYLPDSTDSGYLIVTTHAAAKDFLLVRVKWDGTNGFLARAKVDTKKLSAKAGPNLAEVMYTFNLIPSSIVPVGLGPTL